METKLIRDKFQKGK